jgi:hypothetical protein
MSATPGRFLTSRHFSQPSWPQLTAATGCQSSPVLHRHAACCPTHAHGTTASANPAASTVGGRRPGRPGRGAYSPCPSSSPSATRPRGPPCRCPGCRRPAHRPSSRRPVTRRRAAARPRRAAARHQVHRLDQRGKARGPLQPPAPGPQPQPRQGVVGPPGRVGPRHPTDRNNGHRTISRTMFPSPFAVAAPGQAPPPARHRTRDGPRGPGRDAVTPTSVPRGREQNSRSPRPCHPGRAQGW